MGTKKSQKWPYGNSYFLDLLKIFSVKLFSILNNHPLSWILDIRHITELGIAGSALWVSNWVCSKLHTLKGSLTQKKK
jgi:hypothetical protein